jgi:hypothetical protein
MRCSRPRPRRRLALLRAHPLEPTLALATVVDLVLVRFMPAVRQHLFFDFAFAALLWPYSRRTPFLLVNTRTVRLAAAAW